ncbi:MAG: DUF2341 domain-containing protein [Candidatus Micrarchaeia archaeon]
MVPRYIILLFGLVVLLAPLSFSANDTSMLVFRINLSSSAGNLSNYQVRVPLSLNLSYSNGSDLRIYYFNSTLNDTVSAPFWRESWNYATASGVVWVKVPRIAGSSDYLLAYYGSGSALAAGQPESVFDFYDDFPGSSINLSKWYLSTNSGPAICSDTVSGGYLTLMCNKTSGADNTSIRAYSSNITFSSPYAYNATFYSGTFGGGAGASSSTGFTGAYYSVGEVDCANFGTNAELFSGPGGTTGMVNSLPCGVVNGGAQYWANSGSAFDMSIILNTTASGVKWRPTQFSFQNTPVSSTLRLWLRAYEWNPNPAYGYLKIDKIVVRKQVSPEPSVAVGAPATNPAIIPSSSNFSGISTNFSAIANLSSVPNLTLDSPGKGRIKFPSGYSVNALGQDYDSSVIIGSGFISVNSSALHSSFNSTATLTMNLTGVYSGTGAPTIYYYEAFASSLATIVQNGTVCSAPRCTGVSWNSSTRILTFNVSGFSDYGVNGSGNYSGAGSGPSNSTGTLGINITSTNQIAVYTSSSSNNSAFSFIPVTPPAAGSITLMSNESSNVTGGDTGFLVENQGNVNVSITVASDKNAASFIGGSSPLFRMFGGVNETGACPVLNESMQSLSASDITICPSLAYADSQDTIWAYVLVKIDSDSPPQTSTATLTFTSTQV